MWLALLVACGLPHRVVKSLVAPDYATLSTPTGDVVDVSYQGDPKGPMAPYAPGVFQSDDGRWFAQAVEVTTAGSIDIAPVGDDVGITLWVRSPGLRQQDFVPVRTVSGGLDGQYANEIRFLPVRLNEPLHLDLRQLSNVYNDYELGEGDLLMIEAARPGEDPERYVFLAREFGLRFKYGGGLLFTIPLGFASDNQPDTTSAVLVFTTSFGYRFRTRSPVLRWFGSKGTIMISTGVGSTALSSPDLAKPLEDQLVGHFNATVAGGGFEFYNFFSIQTLVNVTALSRDMEEAPWVLALGFDPVQFALFTRGVGTRIFLPNRLDRPPPPVKQ